MHEIEIKILEINVQDVVSKIENLGAHKTQEVLLKVDWLSFPEHDKNHQPWFLRVRSYNTGKVEITWKGDLENIKNVRKIKEINITVDDHEKTKTLFESIGLVVYAHQEKKRMSWKLGDIVFDLDTYPVMKSYLEIEGPSEEEINNMIKKLGLESHETWSDGERTLIENKHGLNWSDMRF